MPATKQQVHHAIDDAAGLQAFGGTLDFRR
jgi:hypothetical protein